MATINVKPKNNEDVDKKPRVWFTCHPDDFDACFEIICRDIFKTHDCAIYYTDDMSEGIAGDQKDLDLGRSNLFVVPVTEKLLTTSNRAMNEDIPYALENHIPVLPILREAVDDEVYSSKFGELQYLNPLSDDQTEIPYDEKLKKYLESVLISKELADRIRHAFYAYIFLSYRKVDRAYANTLMHLIHSIPDCRDFAIWFDEFLTPGESFKVNIEKALDDCKLFTLLVTKQLFKKRLNEKGKEVDNFVIANELPMAKDKRTEKGTEIIAVEMEDAGEDALSRLEADEYIRYDDLAFQERLLAAIKKIKYDVVDTPEHAFLIGLAYLEGIDMEVDRERAVKLIESAAETDLAEAIEKLIRMYKDGAGVARDVDSVQKWSKRLAEHYFKRIFSKRGTIKSKKKLLELFSHYADEYFTETLKAFLIYVDDRLTEDVITQLYNLLMNQGIYEYTLFFEACKEMSEHKEQAQCALLRDIIQKSADGTYPPYGPLFWYVPEYELYEPLLLTLDTIKDKPYFAKALALTRDVCWIFGRYNTATEITARVNGESLFVTADLIGVRRGLCELFFTGDTAEICGEDVYPRCFNIAEAKHWKEHGCGILGRMLTAFDDELKLYSHNMFSKLGGEYIGIVSTSYDHENIETILPKKSCKKLCGLFLTPSETTVFRPISINDKHLRKIYVPENICKKDCLLPQLCTSFCLIEHKLMFFDDKVIIPKGITTIEEKTFANCSSIKQITIPDGVISIEDDAFAKCTALVSIILPDSVTKIGNRAFIQCSALESVHLGNSVTKLGTAAFGRCTSLTSVVIPNGIMKMDSVFWGCTSLKSIILPNDMTEIGTDLFSNCTSLRSIILPDGITTIKEGAFEGCSSLFAMEIPDSITNIGYRAFAKCTSLVSIALSTNITKIDTSAFANCTSLESIVIPESVKEIGDWVFSDCTSLHLVTIPNGIGYIPKNTFCGCKSLTSVAIPDDITFIGENAFENCISLEVMAIPNSVLYIGKNVFIGCECLQYVYNCPMGYSRSYLGINANCEIHRKTNPADSVLGISGETTKIEANAYFGRWDLEKVLFANNITEIDESAFAGCVSLQSISLPNSLKVINEYAFAHCIALADLIIPDSVINIMSGAFMDCTLLRSIKIPYGTTEVCDSTFLGCTSLSEIILHENIKRIGMGAFWGCASLRSIKIPNSVSAIGEHAFVNCSSLSSVILPNNLTEIHLGAFTGCTQLRSIIIPSQVKTIEDEAFLACTSLQSIVLPEGITRIQMMTFYGCVSLRSVVIPNSITDIEIGAFSDCTSLRTVTIPNTVKYIGASAFSGCSSLQSVCIPEEVEEIADETFRENLLLASIFIPDGIKRIGVKAFYGCSSLIEITIPGKAIVESFSFQNCSSLISVTIPNTVREIGNDAFAGCTALREITISRRFEDKLDRIFGGVDLSQVTICWI